MRNYQVILEHTVDANRTWRGDIMLEMDEWCKKNCKGSVEIMSLEVIWFECCEDIEKFIKQWWGR